MRKLTIIFLFQAVNVWFALGWTPPSPITPPDTIPDAIANMNFGITGGSVPAAGAPACETADQSQEVTGSDTLTSGMSGYEYMSGRIDIDGTGVDVCKIGVFIKKVVDNSDPVYAFTLEVRAENSGEPGAVSATSTTSLGASDLDTSCTEEIFEFATPITLSASTSYRIGSKFTVGGDWGDYIILCAANDPYTNADYSSNGSSWTDGGNHAISYKLYK